MNRTSPFMTLTRTKWLQVSVSALLVFGCCQNAAAQTVVEMYLELPSEMLGQLSNPDEPPQKDAAQRLALLTVKDITNGFLSTKGGVHLAKFSRKSASPLLAVAGGSYAEDGRDAQLQFFAKDEAGKWQDVTASYYQPIPHLVSDALYRKKCNAKHNLSDSAAGTFRINLPRHGRTIMAVVETDAHPPCNAVLFSMEFDGTSLRMDL